jgi:MFS family permease
MLQAGPAEVGLLVAAVWAPNLLSVVVGACVERQPSKKRLMIIANLIQAAGIISLPIAHVVAEVTLPHLFAAALIQGSGGVLYATASQPFFVRMVPKESYVVANSLFSRNPLGLLYRRSCVRRRAHPSRDRARRHGG